jgi:Tol biopolymer transport system component
MARNCPACGRANDDDASFCQGCGAALTASATQSGVTTPATGADATPAAPPPPVTPPTPPATPPTVTQSPVEAPPAPPGTPPVPPGTSPAAGGPPRRGKPAPKWVVALIAVAAIALVCVLAYVFYPRGDDGGEDKTTPSTAATVGVSPSPALGQYLAAAAGPKADRLAAIMEDGTVHPITRFSGQQIWQIAYSPDGKWLACIAGTYKRSELWLFDTATGDARQATANMTNIVAIDSVAWLSAGGLLVAGYTEAPKATGQNAEFLVYDTASGDFSPLQDGQGVPLRGVSVSASRDGVRIAFVTYTDHKTNGYGMTTAKERLEVLDRASGQVAELGVNTADFDVNARAFDEPLISPKGQAIIYRRAGSDVGTSYTVIGTDGTVLMPEKEALMPAGYAWDPGGTKVVFTGQPISGAGNLPATFWQFDTEVGGAPRVIARYKDTVVQDLSWSPDGTTIAWAEYDRKEWRTGTIFLLPAGGGDSTPLVKEALSPVWAPAATGSLQTSPSP